MSLDNPKGIESSVSKNTKQRRTFLKRASAGAAIASIPGRSAWAGIAGSIVASGHGSEHYQFGCTKLAGPNGFGSSSVDYNKTFSGVFGVKPFNRGSASIGNGTDYKLSDILSAPVNSDEAGYKKINLGLALMYLNAVNHGTSGINYPVLSQHSNSPSVFANYLITEARNAPGAVADLFMDTIYEYKHGGGCI